jgi:hypothetical protein
MPTTSAPWPRRRFVYPTVRPLDDRPTCHPTADAPAGRGAPREPAVAADRHAER